MCPLSKVELADSLRINTYKAILAARARTINIACYIWPLAKFSDFVHNVETVRIAYYSGAISVSRILLTLNTDGMFPRISKADIVDDGFYCSHVKKTGTR